MNTVPPYVPVSTFLSVIVWYSSILFFFGGIPFLTISDEYSIILNTAEAVLAVKHSKCVMEVC